MPGSAWISSVDQLRASAWKVSNDEPQSIHSKPPPLSWWLHLKTTTRATWAIWRAEVCCGPGYLELLVSLLGMWAMWGGQRDPRLRVPRHGGCRGRAGERWTALICCDEWSSGSLLLEGKKYILCHNQIWFLFTNKFLGLSLTAR